MKDINMCPFCLQQGAAQECHRRDTEMKPACQKPECGGKHTKLFHDLMIRGLVVMIVMIVMECEEDEEDEKGCMNIVACVGDEANEDRQRSRMTPVGTGRGGGDQEVPGECSGRGGSRSGRGQEVDPTA